MKPCRKCGSIEKIPIKRKHPKTGTPYETTRCKSCHLKYQRDYGHTAKWQQDNKEHIREYQRNYYKNKHKERNGVYAKRLRERQIYNDKELIKEFYKNRPEGYHVDHIIPLNGTKVCGLHTLTNLQYLPITENLKKHNKF